MEIGMSRRQIDSKSTPSKSVSNKGDGTSIGGLGIGLIGGVVEDEGEFAESGVDDTMEAFLSLIHI